MPTLAVLHSTLRKEEKLILEAARSAGAEVTAIDIRKMTLNPERFIPEFDLALERSVSTVKGAYAAEFLDALGIPVFNPPSIARICGDKFLTSLALAKAGVPVPLFAMVFGLEEAVETVEKLGGFPVIIKPSQGSWGRLLAKINDRDGLEAVLEHKDVLGSPPHKAFYIQQYIPKPEYDIRVFIIGRDPVCAIARRSDHWITNTARGARAENLPLSQALEDISRRTADTIGHGLLAVDIFETSDGYLVNEVNHTMEFRNSEEPTGVGISREIVDYCLRQFSIRQSEQGE